MKGLLIRVGVDQEYGGWNAPVDMGSRQFVYVPIPDGREKEYRLGCRRDYQPIAEALQQFAPLVDGPGDSRPSLPTLLATRFAHLDPDFEHLTYGDNGERRGLAIKKMGPGDILAFYAGLRSIGDHHRLVYALIGLYVIRRVVPARSVALEHFDQNAHTRWSTISKNDVIVWAKPGLSGRLERCIPIGEWRARAYRVRKDILSAWGGLRVKDGYIQRSIRPPAFEKAETFYLWFRSQGVSLVRKNN